MLWTVRIYFILSCVQFFLDLPAFFFGVAYTTNDFDERSYGGCLCLCMSSVFLSLDLYYILWACSMLIKFESPLGSNLVKALIGFPTGLGGMLGIVPTKKGGKSSGNSNDTSNQANNQSGTTDKKGKPIGGALGNQ